MSDSDEERIRVYGKKIIRMRVIHCQKKKIAKLTGQIKMKNVVK